MTRRVSSGMITRRLLFAAAVPAFAAPSGAATTTARADDPPEKKPSIFDATFPAPTGANGFEELILAGEKLSEAEKYYSGADHFPLSKKREYLARPASRDALRLLQVGIAKPLAYPKRLPQGNVFAAFGRLRALARLIAVSMYVSCVDGRTDNAVRLAGDALTFSYPMKSMSLIGSLVGLAVDAIVLAPLIKLRDCLSTRECRSLIRLMEQSLAMPDTSIPALSVERVDAMKRVADWREKWDEMCEELTQLYEPSDGGLATPKYPEALEWAALLRTNPSVRERVLNELSGEVSSYYDRANALIADPTGRMTLDPPTAADAFRHPMIPALRKTVLLGARVVQKCVMGRANFQLVAVHAAIRAFRWENEYLPKSLEELGLGANLLTGPFTAKPLLYKPEPTGTGYDLASAGRCFRAKTASRMRGSVSRSRGRSRNLSRGGVAHRFARADRRPIEQGLLRPAAFLAERVVERLPYLRVVRGVERLSREFRQVPVLRHPPDMCVYRDRRVFVERKKAYAVRDLLADAEE